MIICAGQSERWAGGQRVRLFLDANVLISASWKEESRVIRLWRIPGTELVTSNLVIDECERNLFALHQSERLRQLLSGVRVLHFERTPRMENLPPLSEKDRHVFAAAVLARADYLVTGDRRHFGLCYGTSILRIRVEPPGRFPKVLEEA